MHPPRFSEHQRLSDWPECWLYLQCWHCRGRSTTYPVKLMIQRHGDGTIQEALHKLKCKECHRQPAPIYLCASPHHRKARSITPDWAVELVPLPTDD